MFVLASQLRLSFTIQLFLILSAKMIGTEQSAVLQVGAARSPDLLWFSYIVYTRDPCAPGLVILQALSSSSLYVPANSLAPGVCPSLFLAPFRMVSVLSSRASFREF